MAAGVARQQWPVNNGWMCGTVEESLWNINSLGNLFTVQSKGTNSRPVTQWPKCCAWLLDFHKLAFISIIASCSGQTWYSSHCSCSPVDLSHVLMVNHELELCCVVLWCDVMDVQAGLELLTVCSWPVFSAKLSSASHPGHRPNAWWLHNYEIS